MSGESSRGVGARADALAARAREEERRATEEQAARWAQVLTPHVIAHLPPPVLASAAPTPGGWRKSDGALTLPTPGAAVAGGAAGGDGTAAAKPSERLVVNVQTSDLGELSLVVDRTATGVRVVIGVGDAQTIGQMLPEREALARQLIGSGLNVESIQIVRQSEVGTLLAPARLVGRLRASATADEASKEEEKSRRRGSRKLNLIG